MGRFPPVCEPLRNRSLLRLAQIEFFLPTSAGRCVLSGGEAATPEKRNRERAGVKFLPHDFLPCRSVHRLAVLARSAEPMIGRGAHWPRALEDSENKSSGN
jgi:hypothetical protein